MSSRAPEVPFTEPWQAQVFAMTVHLHNQGLFTWAEWAAVLSAEVRGPDAALDGSDYYHHWTAALEKLMVANSVTTQTAVADVSESWMRAAHATPHGQPIELANDPAG